MAKQSDEKKTNGHARLRSSLKAGLRDLFHVDGLLDLSIPVWNRPKNWSEWFFMLATAAGFWWIMSRIIESLAELCKP